MSKIYAYVLRTYRTASFSFICALLLATAKGILDNATVFTTPGFTAAEAKAIYDALVGAQSAYKKGGSSQETPYKTALANAIAFLDKLALMVEAVAKGNSGIIIQSNFEPTSTNVMHVGLPVQVQSITQSKLTVETEIELECEAYEDGVNYICVMLAAMFLPTDFSVNNQGLITIPPCTTAIYIDASKQRKKKFTGLTSGVRYYFYYIVVNTAGASVISNVKIITCK